MSEEQNKAIQQSQKKQNKTKQQKEKEKNNTVAWLKKQQQKKKKKLQQANKPPAQTDKAKQKTKGKQKKTQTNQPLKKQNKKSEKIQEAPQITKKVEEKLIVPQNTKKKQENPQKFTQLLSLEKQINKLSTERINKRVQADLIIKYLDQYVNENDTILVLSKSQIGPLKQCNRVFIQNLEGNDNENKNKSGQDNIICTYQDIPLLFEGTVTKIFVELDLIFANGFALTSKQFSNIIDVANQYKIPIIGFTPSWNYNGWNFLSLQMFINRYGQSYLQQYGILEPSSLQILVLQIGSIIPQQITSHIQNLCKVYRGLDLNSIKW